jgi:cell division protease FtsH
LEVHAKGKPLTPDFSLDGVAKQTPGVSGADLANLVNESAILAARWGNTSIGSNEFGEAIDRLVAGPERKSRVISQHEKTLTAYHEAGHALVAQMSPHADVTQKISIVARGSMGGYTRFLPEEERSLGTKEQFKAMLGTAMGGRVAEQLAFGEITTGASNDFEQATRVARNMVTRYGMSETLGPRTFGRREELVFLGREMGEQRDYSDKIAEQIDVEVHDLIEEAHQTATKILTEFRGKLDQIAQYLVEFESVEGEELKSLFEIDSSLTPDVVTKTVRSGHPSSTDSTGQISDSPRPDQEPDPGPTRAPAPQ